MSNSVPSPFIQFLLNQSKTSFWIIFSCAFITGYVQLLQNKSLKNEAAPNGIMSLELGKNFKADTSIVASWQKTKTAEPNTQDKKTIYEKGKLIQLAATNIIIDFFFIVFYTWLSCLVIVRLQAANNSPKPKLTLLLLTLAVIAGIMDAVENTGMLLVIHYMTGIHKLGYNENIALYSIAAWSKFIILGFFAFLYLPYMLLYKGHGLQKLTVWLSVRMEQLRRYRVIFLGIAGFSIPMWISNQGQDLLVNSNAEDTGILVFLLAVIVIALLNWYLAKLFFQKQFVAPVYAFEEPKPQPPDEKKLSRFLGVLTILAPAGAILNALKATNVGYPLDIFPPEAWLVFLLIIFYLCIKFDFAGMVFGWIRKHKGLLTAKSIFLIVIVCLVIVIPLLIRLYLGNDKHKPESLICLYWHLLFISIAFYLFVSIRNEIFRSSSWLGGYIGKLVFVLVMVCALLFLVLNFFPFVFVNWNNHYMTLPSLLAGVVFYIFLSTIVIRLGQKKKINYIFFLIVLLLGLSTLHSNYHSVKRIPAVYPGREMSLQNYFKSWVLKRRAEIEHDSIYPVYLVNTYGGGIRAAAFHSLTINWLDSVFAAETISKQSFEHFVFSVSGASGGTIGAAIQSAYHHQYLDTPGRFRMDSFISYYQHDFLSPVLITDLGRDLLGGTQPLHWWNDRASITDETWERISRNVLKIEIGQEYQAIWRDTLGHKGFETPLLFSNTLNVDDGLKGICAPVRLTSNDFPATIIVSDLVDSLNAHQNANDSARNLSLITGAFLSARFPYLSPSGKMGAGYHFIDGGGKDNSGAGTSELIFAALGRYADSLSAAKPTNTSDAGFIPLLKKIRFCFVSINNSAHTKEPRTLVENHFEPLSPVIGIVNSGIDGNAHAADSTLRSRYGQNDSMRHLGFYTSYFLLYPTADSIRDIIDSAGQKILGRRYTPVLPLGWQISESALQRMAASFTTPGARRVMGSEGVDGVVNMMRRQKSLRPKSN